MDRIRTGEGRLPHGPSGVDRRDGKVCPLRKLRCKQPAHGSDVNIHLVNMHFTSGHEYLTLSCLSLWSQSSQKRATKYLIQASFQYLGVAEPERVNPRCALEGEDGLMSMM